MPRPRKPKIDLTQQKGNPSSAIEKAYGDLMGIQDVNELKQAAVNLVQPFVGKGFSPTNWKKFQLAMAKARSTMDVQRYLTNFMLAGGGMSVGEDRIAALASVITEDTHKTVRLTTRQRRLKTLAESYGWPVVVEAEDYDRRKEYGRLQLIMKVAKYLNAAGFASSLVKAVYAAATGDVAGAALFGTIASTNAGIGTMNHMMDREVGAEIDKMDSVTECEELLQDPDVQQALKDEGYDYEEGEEAVSDIIAAFEKAGLV